MGHAEGYILPQGSHLPEDPGNHRSGRHGRADAGRPASRSEDRVVRRPAAQHQGAFPIHLHCFSAPEVTNIAEVSGLTLRDTIARLTDAGLDSIPGGGAEILDDAVRHRISRLKCTHAGLDRRSSHRPPAGHAHHRHHDVRLRRNPRAAHEPLRARAPICRKRPAASPPSSPGPSSARTPRSAASSRKKRRPWSICKTLAISRIYLDNFENVQASWVTPGPEDLPDRPALRRQRRRQHHDRRERGVAPPAPITAPAKRNSAA